MRIGFRIGLVYGVVAVGAAVVNGLSLRASAQEPLQQPDLGEVCDQAPTACLLFDDAWATVGTFGEAAGSGGRCVRASA